MRVLVDRLAGRYDLKRIARADDHEPADGSDTLTYLQARERAHRHARDAGRGGPEAELQGAYTVRQAVNDYLEWFAAHRKRLKTTRTPLAAHVLPRFGSRLVTDLTKTELARRHARLATTRARVRTASIARAQGYREQDLTEPDTLRRRRSSANRILATFQAMLNHAWRDGHVHSDAAWRPLRPFKGVDEPRIRYLEHEEARRLVNACGPELRPLVRAGLLTGCRYGELVALHVEDFRPDAGTVYVAKSKSGKPRHVPLTDEGLEFFSELAAACARANISPPISFHVLRHSYGSWLAQRSVALQVIAEALGHADTRITQRHYGHLTPSYVAQVIRQNLPQLSTPARKLRAIRSGKSSASAAVRARLG